MFSKRGISPLIATVLLIGFTIVLAAVVFRWAGNLFDITTETQECSGMGQVACTSQVSFSTGILYYNENSGYVTISNDGTTDIINMNIQRETSTGEKLLDKPAIEIAPGNSVNIPFSFSSSSSSIKAFNLFPTIKYTTTENKECSVPCTQTLTIIPTSGTKAVKIDGQPPIVNLQSPDNPSNYYSLAGSINFICRATDDIQLDEISFINTFGAPPSTRAISGTDQTVTFTFSVPQTSGTYTWNCEASDQFGNNAQATTSRTITQFCGNNNWESSFETCTGCPADTDGTQGNCPNPLEHCCAGTCTTQLCN